MASSQKSHGEAEFESTLERDLLTLLEFDTTVERYEVQPVRIDYVDEEDRARPYTPDVLVFYPQQSGGEPPRPPLLSKVKPRAVLAAQWMEIRRKVRAARAYCQEPGEPRPPDLPGRTADPPVADTRQGPAHACRVRRPLFPSPGVASP